MAEALGDPYLDTTPVSKSTAEFPTLKPTTWKEFKGPIPVEVTGAGDVDGTGRKAFFLHLEAKPGKEDAVQAFLRDINKGVDEEPLTGPWFALRYSKTSFLIFEAFPDHSGRREHTMGPGGAQFLRVAEIEDFLAFPTQIYKFDVLHGKFGIMMGQPVTPVVT
ncbi:hypothetical protein BKA61DRAFT_618095 [Leptodontidium sp. MPI-SDFR-AT-0119]|nr:hypothetical protein BKA61DRAFT_618095 [Leptodontidium sp. MPI-SDFR-AT-0119]